MPLMDPETKRCIWLDQDAAIHGRGSYYLGILRQLLANVGTELPVPKEELSEASYAVAFDAIRHTFFKMRHGKPALLGGDVASNEWRYYADQTAILANKYLRSIESEHRIAPFNRCMAVWIPTSASPSSV